MVDVNHIIESILEGNRPPVAELIGFDMIECKEGTAKFTMTASKKHHNPMGTLHGGILCDITDAAMAMAVATELTKGETLTTINLQINFIKQVQEAELVVEGRIIKRGRSIGYAEAKVLDHMDNLIATATSTCKISRIEDLNELNELLS